MAKMFDIWCAFMKDMMCFDQSSVYAGITGAELVRPARDWMLCLPFLTKQGKIFFLTTEVIKRKGGKSVTAKGKCVFVSAGRWKLAHIWTLIFRWLFTGSTTTTNYLSNAVFLLCITCNTTTVASVHWRILWPRRVQLTVVRSSVHGARLHIALQTADAQHC